MVEIDAGQALSRAIMTVTRYSDPLFIRLEGEGAPANGNQVSTISSTDKGTDDIKTVYARSS